MRIRYPYEFHNPLICLANGDPPPDPAGGAGAPPAAAGGDTPPNPDPAAGASPADGSPPVQPPVVAAPQPDPNAWKDKQIDRQHRKIKELETQAAKAADLEAENARLRELAGRTAPAAPPVAPGAPPAAPPVTATPPAPAAPAAPTDAIAKARFDIEVENLTKQVTAEPEWPTVAANLQKMGGVPPDVMNGIFASDDPAFVLMTLGKDPNKFQEILDLPPQKQTAALIKIGMQQTAPKPPVRPSGAPPPVAPVVGGAGGQAPVTGSVDLYDPKMQMAGPPLKEFESVKWNPRADEYDPAWYAERARQKRESTGRPWSLSKTGQR